MDGCDVIEQLRASKQFNCETRTYMTNFDLIFGVTSQHKIQTNFLVVLTFQSPSEKWYFRCHKTSGTSGSYIRKIGEGPSEGYIISGSQSFSYTENIGRNRSHTIWNLQPGVEDTLPCDKVNLILVGYKNARAYWVTNKIPPYNHHTSVDQKDLFQANKDLLVIRNIWDSICNIRILGVIIKSQQCK